MSSLNKAGVEYLLIGGYAVGYHGYARTTADIDVWVRQSPENAARVTEAVRAFGFDVPALRPDAFLGDDRVVRMGVPPYRIEILTSVSGLGFEEAWEGREVADWDGIDVPVIGLRALRTNKQASGRLKDLADLDALPEADDDV
ncbi:MAG: hypothetical protein AAF845_14110 [Bacteroidota bacterium]